MTMTPTLNWYPHAVMIPGVSIHRASGVVSAATFSVLIWPGILSNADFSGVDATKEPSYGTLASYEANVAAGATAVVSTVNLKQTISGFVRTIDTQALNVGIGATGSVFLLDKRVLAAGFVTLEIVIASGSGAYFLNLQTVCQ